MKFKIPVFKWMLQFYRKLFKADQSQFEDWERIELRRSSNPKSKSHPESRESL